MALNRSRRGVALVLTLVGAVWLVLSCGSGSRAVAVAPVPAVPDTAIVQSILLAGDAGAPRPDDPTLAALAREAARFPAHTTVIFLGDNIYPTGLSTTGSSRRPEDERRLSAQLATIQESGARGVFVPGNHDWDDGGQDGWQAVLRQEGWVRDHGAGQAEWLPGGGCPGPAVRDLGETFRLVVLDTQWWLHDHDRPFGLEAGCTSTSYLSVEANLGAAVAATGRQVIVVGHHPLRSGGAHGGHFNLRQHLFPLTELAGWAWLPLPLIGSLYPLARSGGISSQDVSHPRNQAMRIALEDAMATVRPLVYASGHEHNLQVIEGGSARWLLVSGSGHSGQGAYTTWLPETRFAASTSGFMRLDAVRSGRIRLGVFQIQPDGTAREVWSAWLE